MYLQDDTQKSKIKQTPTPKIIAAASEINKDNSNIQFLEQTNKDLTNKLKEREALIKKLSDDNIKLKNELEERTQKGIY